MSNHPFSYADLLKNNNVSPIKKSISLSPFNNSKNIYDLSKDDEYIEDIDKFLQKKNREEEKERMEKYNLNKEIPKDDVSKDISTILSNIIEEDEYKFDPNKSRILTLLKKEDIEEDIENNDFIKNVVDEVKYVVKEVETIVDDVKRPIKEDCAENDKDILNDKDVLNVIDNVLNDNVKEFIENDKTKKNKKNDRDVKSLPSKFKDDFYDHSHTKSWNSPAFNFHKKKFFNRHGPREQFITKAQTRRRLDSDNKKFNKNFYCGGILPFHVKNKTIYFLLGKDNEGKWSDFGGRSEGADMGRWDVTATREFYEETIGSIMDIPTMMSKLQHKKTHIKVKGKTLNGSAYFMYVVKIPYKESHRQIFQSTLNFIKYTKVNAKNRAHLEYKYYEKSDIQWVSIDTLKTSMESENSDVVNYPLRGVFKKTLEGHIDRILEFCNNFYGSENYW